MCRASYVRRSVLLSVKRICVVCLIGVLALSVILTMLKIEASVGSVVSLVVRLLGKLSFR